MNSKPIIPADFVYNNPQRHPLRINSHNNILPNKKRLFRKKGVKKSTSRKRALPFVFFLAPLKIKRALYFATFFCPSFFLGSPVFLFFLKSFFFFHPSILYLFCEIKKKIGHFFASFFF